MSKKSTDKVEIFLKTPRLGRIAPEIGKDAVCEIGTYYYRIMYELIGDTKGNNQRIHALLQL